MPQSPEAEGGQLAHQPPNPIPGQEGRWGQMPAGRAARPQAVTRATGTHPCAGPKARLITLYATVNRLAGASRYLAKAGPSEPVRQVCLP